MSGGTRNYYISSSTQIASGIITPGQWTLDQTLTPSAVSTVSTTGLAVYKQYMIIIKSVLGAGNDDVLLRLNADSGANYDRVYINNTTVTQETAQTGIFVFQIGTVTAMDLMLYLGGKCAAAASGRIVASIVAGTERGGAGKCMMGGTWAGGSGVQVTSITLVSAAATNFTGTIEIWGRN